MSRDRIFAEINTERMYQDGKWGTAFDDRNTLNDWVTYIVNYMARAAVVDNQDKPLAQREAMVKVATLAVAALETFDRNEGFAPRHYETR